MTAPFCEVYARILLPALKAMIAKELVNVYGLTQLSAAKMLGTTQPLINYYLSGKRGSRLLSNLSNSEELISYVKSMATQIMEGKIDRGTLFCTLCMYLRGNEELLKSIGIIGPFVDPKCCGNST